MSRLKQLLLVAVVAMGFSLLAPLEVHAWNPFGAVDCSGEAGKSAVCVDRDQTGDPVSGENGLVLRIVDLLALVSGAVAIIIIILSGLRFVTAGGSTEDISGARRTLIYAVVGLVVIVIARTLVAFIVTKI